MSSWKVEVGVALSRPPRLDAFVYVELSPEHTWPDAELAACQIAQTDPRVVMAVSSVVTDWPESVESP